MRLASPGRQAAGAPSVCTLFFEREFGALERSAHGRVVDENVLPVVPKVAELLEGAVILFGDEGAKLCEVFVLDLRLRPPSFRLLRFDGARRLGLLDSAVCRRRADAKYATEQDPADPGILAVLDDAASKVCEEGGRHEDARSERNEQRKTGQAGRSDQPQ